MKKLFTIVLAGIIAINANAQLTPEGIMALLPDMPSQSVMIEVATHNTEFNDRSADILVRQAMALRDIPNPINE